MAKLVFGLPLNNIKLAIGSTNENDTKYCYSIPVRRVAAESGILLSAFESMLPGSEGLQDMKQCSKNEELCSKLE